LQPWDVPYYAEKLRQQLYDFDEEELRPYFPVESVMGGMFQIFARLFGIHVVEQTGVPAWDAAVEILSHRRRGVKCFPWWILCRLVPAGKQARGGVDGLVHNRDPDSSKPHLGLICGNMTPPLPDKPALLTHREVETIFHEFGHFCIIGLSRVNVRSLSGHKRRVGLCGATFADHGELVLGAESLDLFARHYQNRRAIPQELFEKWYGRGTSAVRMRRCGS